jgi:hypothetical protein
LKPDPDYIQFRTYGTIARPIRASRQGTGPNRNRWLYLSLTVLVIGLGLFSRSRMLALPATAAKVSGDALWALMVFFAIIFLWPRLKTRMVIIAALLFSFAIEFSQLYHAPWIDHLRSFRFGELILGTTFNWPDFGSYTIGVAVGAVADWLLTRRSQPRVKGARGS